MSQEGRYTRAMQAYFKDLVIYGTAIQRISVREIFSDIHPKEASNMDQVINESHRVNAEGNPAGGNTSGTGILISWQDGPLAVDGVRKQPNGAFVEGVIKAAKGRLEFYQASKFACPENARAIECLDGALRDLASRTKERTDRGVEGTHGV